jgi:hypothetical protein
MVSILLNQVASSTPVDIELKVPWDNVKLVYGYSIITVVNSSHATFNVDIELTTAGGTAMATMAPAKSDAVGTVTELTISDPAACGDLNDDSILNLEVTGTSSSTGQMMLYLYFEPTVS